jgi:hypothetical protein
VSRKPNVFSGGMNLSILFQGLLIALLIKYNPPAFLTKTHSLSTNSTSAAECTAITPPPSEFSLKTTHNSKTYYLTTQRLTTSSSQAALWTINDQNQLEVASAIDNLKIVVFPKESDESDFIAFTTAPDDDAELYILDGFSIVECEGKRVLVWKNADFGMANNEEPYFCFYKKRSGQKMVRVQKDRCQEGTKVEIEVVIAK